VENLSQEQTDYSPGTGRWSVGELVDHLLLAEKSVRDAMATLIELRRAGRQALLRRSFADANVSLWFIPKVLLPLLESPLTMLNLLVPRAAREFMLRHPLVPAQNADNTTPDRGRHVAELREDLLASIRATEALLESDRDLDYCNMAVAHPLLGTNNVPQLVRMLALHEQRHHAQVSAILRGLRLDESSSRLLCGARRENAELPTSSVGAVPEEAGKLAKNL
jgi:uncharacterized damage-inducible protein DinB